MILAMDTTTKKLSICIQQGSKIFEYDSSENFQHGKYLVPAIQQLLEENALQIKSIQTILVALGPGSYTGIRIGIATALALRHSLQANLYGVSTLRGMSYLVEDSSVAPILDARRGNIYGACYGKIEVEECNEDFETFYQRVKGAKFIGEDVDNFPLNRQEKIQKGVQARTLIAAYLDGHYTEDIVPNYLREVEAKRRKDNGTDSRD